MKKRIGKRALSLLLSLLMCLSFLNLSALAADEVSLAEFVFSGLGTTQNTSLGATGGLYAASTAITAGDGTDQGLRGNTNGTWGQFSMSNTNIYTVGWRVNSSCYWQIVTSTADYENIGLSFKTYSTSAGPSTMRIEVKADDGPFVTWEGNTYSPPINNNVNDAITVTKALPASAADAETLTIRLYADAVAGAGSGNNRIFNIYITGTPIGDDPPPVTLDAPTAAPAPGEYTAATLPASIALTAADGATIYYTTDGSTPDTTSAAYSGPIDTSGLTAPFTIQAFAAKDGAISSSVAAFTYTVKTVTPPGPGGDWETTGETASVVEWSFPSSTDATTMPKPATGGVNAVGASLSTTASGSATFTGNGAVNLTGWDGAAGSKYWQLAVSTLGFAKLNFAFSSQSSGTGPADFKVTYSVDGGATFKDFDGNTFAVVNSFVGKSFSLPNEAANTANLLIRIATNSTTNVNGTVTGSGGTSRIGGIVLTGEYILDENQVAAVTAAPAPGAVAAGTVVQLATTTSGATILVSDDGTAYTPAASVTLDTLPKTFYAKAVKGGMIDSRVKTFTYTQAKLSVQASPLSGAVLPGTAVSLTTGSGATIYYTMDGTTPDTTSTVYTGPITLTAGMLPITITACAVGTGYIDSDILTLSYTAKDTGGERNYFGQLHAHTTNSDGQGTLAEAFAWARDEAKLDFFAVTDHSNSFDTAPSADKAGTYNLGAYNATNAAWVAGQTAAASARRANYISVYGYEMTWSGGPGHINTFNTTGFVSRLNTELNSKTNDAGLRAYYELLKTAPGSISQFNHPGTTFGNFSNFAYWDPMIDKSITLIEVGNGEGTIGSGGYFPSYEQYTMALDKGWHVAPTNNQDNHKKGWGTSNTCRTVIWTNDLSETGLYQALRERRVYATEVSDLDIVYKANGLPLGTIEETVPDSVTFTANIKNPTAGNTVKSVSIITTGGVEIGKQTFNTQNVNYEWTLEAPDAGYYYLRVIDLVGGKERIAVTAPVWFGAGVKVGITEVTKSAVVPVTTEELTLSTSLFNVGETAATLTSITYEQLGGAVLYTATPDTSIAPNGGSITHKMNYTPTAVGETIVVVTATILVDGEAKVFTREITYNVLNINTVNFIGIDGSHYNEYVAGNYKDNMGNFIALAGKYNVRVNILNTKEELIAAAANPQYKMLLLTAPSRRLYPNLTQIRSYEPEVIAAIAAFAESGGTLILTGWSDLYENYSGLAGMAANQHMAAQQNQILAAIGATLRLTDDAAGDTVYCTTSGTDPEYRMYLVGAGGSYHDSPLLAGVDLTQQYSQYGGSTVHAVAAANKGVWNAAPATVLPSSITRIVSTSANGVSRNRDNDSAATAPKYDGKYMVLASETLDHGNGKTSEVLVAGGAFMSNFEIQAEMDNWASLPYSNYNILSNLIQSVEPDVEITSIADAKLLPEGTTVTIEGIATSGVNTQSVNADTNKGFFDCIYVQDATAGINLFPVSSGVAEGQKIRVTGKLSAYQGETQLAVTSVRVLDASVNHIAPTALTTAAAMLPENTGLLIETSGIVTEVIGDGGSVSQFTIDDGSGPATVFLNAYITPAISLDFVTVGANVSVVGLASVGEVSGSSDMLPRIRVRDRGEIFLLTTPPVVDKTELNALILLAEGLVEANYTPATWALFAQTLLEAKAVAADPDATQAAVNSAKTYLNAAIESLVAVTPDTTVKASLRATQTQYNSTDDVTVIVSLSNVTGGINYVELTLEIDGTRLGFSSAAALNGFSLFGAIDWVEKDNGIWQGKAGLVIYGNLLTQDADILTLTFTPKGVLGEANVKLTDIVVQGLVDYRYKELPSAMVDASVDVSIFSKYDLNKDFKVDRLDFGILLLYVNRDSNDANWETYCTAYDEYDQPIYPFMCDVTGPDEDGICRVDMADLLDLLLHYTPTK